MRNIPYLFWIFLLVNGESGVKELHLMVGDSVTLNSAVSKILSNETTQWMFEMKRIAQLKANSIGGPQYYEEDFKDQLQLDMKNGSLTIKNISAKHSGEYKQNIAGTDRITRTLKVTEKDNSRVVMVGDRVILKTGATGIQRHQVLWTFGDDPYNYDDKRWSNANLNNESGDLIIDKIKGSQFGIYTLKITTNSTILQRHFNVILSDIKILPLMEGNHVTLYNSITVKTGDHILWLYGNESIPIAEVKIKVDKPSYRDSAFRDRLKLDLQTGSLTISNTRTSDSGLYMMKINSDRGEHKYTRYVVNVNVSDTSSWSLGLVIFGSLLVGAVAAVLAFLWLYYKKCKGATAGERNGSAKGSDEAEGLHQDTSIS